MIRLADVVARIAAQCPAFAHVEHALTSAGQHSLPAALVSPIKIAGQPNQFLSGHAQKLEVTVGVFVMADRKTDTGPAFMLANAFDDLQAQVRAAMVGWQAPGAAGPFDLAGGELDRYRGDGPVTWREDYAALVLLQS
jgi:hypothetical protein